MKRLIKKHTFLVLAIFVVAISYGNCSRVSMYGSPKPINTVNELSAQQPKILSTTPNISIQTLVGQSTSLRTIKIRDEFVSQGVKVVGSLDKNSTVSSPVTEMKTKSGKITLSDSSFLSFVYTPNIGFRGTEIVTIYLLAKGFYAGEVILKVTVNNPPTFNNQYSLAVRAPGCILCHAHIEGNFITDLGYGLKKGGDEWFFGKASASGWPFYGAYGDHGNSTASSGNEFVNSSIILPNVSLSKTLSSSIAAYHSANKTGLSMGVDASGNSTLQDYFNMVLPTVAAQTFGSVYIGAPTETRIAELFNSAVKMGAQGWDQYSSVITIPNVSNALYFPDSFDNVSPLSGLAQDTNGVVYNKPGEDFACEGDLVINGVGRFTNINLRSVNGCRIYATQTLFIDGDIRYSPNESNIQFTSARAIIFGVGTVTSDKNNPLDSTNTKTCGDFPSNRGGGPQATYPVGTDVVRSRVNGISYYGMTRHAASDGNSLDADIATILQDSTLANGTILGVRQDATCIGPGAVSCVAGFICRNQVNFKHVLLNAPIIQGRYSGEFKGMIIAEYMVWALGKFSFTRDSYFSQFPLLPLLDFSNEVLKVK